MILTLKGKFEKLANTKKPTGDPSCLNDVRRAKSIARDMLNRANAGTVGSSSEEDDDSENDEKYGKDDESPGQPILNAMSESSNPDNHSTAPKTLPPLPKAKSPARNPNKTSAIIVCRTES